MEKIPDEVRKQIEAEAEKQLSVSGNYIPFKQGAEFGYSLASKALSDANKEIEFLKMRIKHLEEDIKDESPF